MNFQQADAPIAARSPLPWYRGVLPPGQRTPLSLLIIQSTAFCNIDCSYCYLPNRSTKGQLSFDLLELLFSKLLKTGLLPDQITAAWHAGEPLVLPPSYYAEAFARIGKVVAGKCRVNHNFQTNATLITQDYCDLIRAHNVQIGLSLDGPEFIHDKHRTSRSGAGSFARAMTSVDLLHKNGIPFSAIAVLTQESLDYPDEIYDFFKGIGVRELGLNIEEKEGVNETSSLNSEEIEARYKLFMKQILQRILADRQPLLIREFKHAIAQTIGSFMNRENGSSEANPLSIISCDMNGNICTYSPELVDITAPDGTNFSIGNIRDIEFDRVFEDPRLQRLNNEIQLGVTACRETCGYFNVCGGGAPANKLAENGSFNSTETMFCRYKHKVIVDIVEEFFTESFIKSRKLRREGPKADRHPQAGANGDLPGVGGISQGQPAERKGGLPPILLQAIQSIKSNISTGAMVQDRIATAHAPPTAPARRLSLAGLATSPGRLRLSAGTTSASALGLKQYEDLALVPRPDWRQPDSKEINSLVATGTSLGVGGFVAVVRPPHEIIERLMSIREDRARAPAGANLADINAAYSDIVGVAAPRLAQAFADQGQPTKVLGIGVNPSGLTTATINRATGLRLGLHLDSWTQLPADQRNGAPNRLCINLGLEPRYLLFIDVLLAEVLERLPMAQLPPGMGPTDLAREFMKRYPEHPVVSLRIDPGEAYIAPTENMIHDGSTEGMQNPDICLTLLGHFHRPA